MDPIVLALTEQAGVSLYLKREDLLHPLYGGNKIRKLKYNVEECIRQKKTGLLTCGGAYSNHLLATAAYASEQGLKAKAIIRGEELLVNNSTLQDAAALGMEFVFISREHYRMLRADTSLAFNISNSDKRDYFFIPEGGTNTLAIKGIMEVITEIDIPFDYIATPCGTGGTYAGLMKGLHGRKEKLLVFSALKNGDYIQDDIKVLLADAYNPSMVELFTSAYCFGGYGKMKAELKNFVNSFKEQTGILLDPIYNGKMLYGLLELIKEGYFKKGSVIVALHTGGVQAWRGYGEAL